MAKCDYEFFCTTKGRFHHMTICTLSGCTCIVDDYWQRDKCKRLLDIKQYLVSHYPTGKRKLDG